MPFRDIPSQNPYVRLFYKVLPPSRLVWSSHGLWRPAREGLTRVQYHYYFYSQPNAPLSNAAYKSLLDNLHTADPKDILGPGSGEVANYLLVPLDQHLFGLTVRPFVEQRINGENPGNLALLAFMGSNALPGMSLRLLDQQLLPFLNYPLAAPVHMIICRSLQMR